MPRISHPARRTTVFTLLTLGLFATAGCRSAYIEATVINTTGAPVSLVEVDYPSASFGREALAAGAQYHYRFKILGDGATKVLWTDATHKDHTVPGPVLHEGNEGRLTIIIGPSTATWNLALTRP